MNRIFNFDDCKDLIRIHLVSKSFAASKGSFVITREFLDLVELPVIELNDANVYICKGMLTEWGVSEDDVWNAGHENYKKDGYAIKNMRDLLIELYNVDIEEILEESVVDRMLFVFSNKRIKNGAIAMTDIPALKEFAESVGVDLCIIPSSIHEVMIFPLIEGLHYEDMQEMIQAINIFYLPDREILSNHPYVFRKDTGYEM